MPPVALKPFGEDYLLADGRHRIAVAGGRHKKHIGALVGTPKRAPVFTTLNTPGATEKQLEQLNDMATRRWETLEEAYEHQLTLGTQESLRASTFVRSMFWTTGEVEADFEYKL